MNKRRWLRLLLSVMVMIFLTLPVYATDVEDSLLEDLCPDTGLPPGVMEAIGGFDPDTPLDFGGTLKTLFFSVLPKCSDALAQGLAASGMILASVLLCGMADISEKGRRAGAIIGTLAITATCTQTLSTMIRLGTDTLSQISDYSGFLLPAVATLMAASGGTASSTSVYTATVFFLQLLMTLISRLLAPMIYGFVAVAAAEAAMDTGKLVKLREFIRWLIGASLKTIVYGFTGFLTLTGFISGSTDAAALKAAKVTISGAVPVVGSIISDAADTVLTSAASLKGALGTYGMLAVLAICLLPFLQIAIQYLLLKGTTAVSGLIGCKNHVTLVENITQAMGLLLGMAGAYVAMLLLSVTVCVKAVGG